MRGRPGGIGRHSSPAAERVSDQLRRGSDGHLTARRRAGAFLLTATGALAAVSAYQFGIVRHLPDPPFSIFRTDEVDASGEAYAFLKTPDATLSIATYGTTLALVGMGGSDRAEKRPWIALAATAKTAIDAAGAATLTVEQWSKHRAFCFYCAVAAGATFGALASLLPEARAAWRQLRSSRG